ncbi:ATPase, partial [Cryptococcus neoformans]
PPDDAPAPLEQEPHHPPSTGRDLLAYATEVIHPSTPAGAFPQDLQPVLTHLSTAFLPRNQHLATDPVSSPFTHVISFPPGAHGRAQTDPSREEEDSEPAPENVIALASPFEGGDIYVKEAVQTLANEMEADVVRLDLVMGLALDGMAAPLGVFGPPPLSQSLNPLYQAAPSPFPNLRKESREAEDQEESMGLGFTSMPVAVLGGGGLPMPQMGHMGQQEEDFVAGRANEEWIAFFSRIINAETAEAGKKRIVLLESPLAMSKTFPIWWPSLVEAVQRRRRGLVTPGRKKMIPKNGNAEPSLVHPTSIVLQCTPSPLLPHTSPSMFAPTEKEDHELAAEEHVEDVDEQEEATHAAISALEDKFRSMGFNVHHHVEVVKPRSGAKLWWGNEESDPAGRREGDQSRLKAILGKGLSSVLPPFDGQSSDSGNQPRNPLQRLLMSRMGHLNRSEQNESSGAPLVWKAFPIAPLHRNFAAEKESRTLRRRIYSAALIARAVYQLGGELQDPLGVLKLSESTGRPLTRKTGPSSVSKGWGNAVVSWSDALHIASIAVGRAVQNGQVDGDVATVHWADIITARQAAVEEKTMTADQISKHIPAALEKDGGPTKAAKKEEAQQIVDPVVEKLRKDKKLSQHEKRLLNCIVDPSKLSSTTFRDVHLPEKTIDGIRSMISLPLLFPEAFRGGVLKDHATTGALLFGPPGTGKTLLARAVAAESGARMLAIQPSDVNDMYVGEGEKLVKAVFSLARRLSPCVVFLDEVDALFGARISRGSSGSMSHNLILTEFMQEMDGLSSAIANKDKRVVVIGATNRPFDLDDAVMRRLPRRLLVDLPGVEDRKAILEILLRGEQLGEDVHLDQIAKDTDGFSGSDLKHLCVSAALSAVKDTVNVPWRQLSPSSMVSSSFGSEERPRTPLPGGNGGGGGGLGNEVLVMAPTEGGGGGGGGRKKVRVKKEKASATASYEESVLSAAREESETPVEEQLGTSEAPEEVEGEQLLSADRTRDASPIEDAPEPAKTPVEEEQTVPKRVLMHKHFKTALEEIRPSASEEGSLPELRKWAEQFGEGGKRRGKKSGFGKGFGFSDEPVRDRDTGYGKVRQDD